MAVKEPWNINLGYPVNCACESADKSVNWTNIAGNSIEYTYVGNNVTVAQYYTGATLVFTQTFTYDVNNNVTSVVTS